jgi:Fe-S cluster biogenesis protein NfuA/nitrite reductase/ring-hydroxylating ferredoxin subunit
MDDRQARECVARVEVLLEKVEELRDPAARETATELVGALLDLYGEGLARITTQQPQLVAPVLGDELVSHLLLLHGLHPVPLEQRVRQALEDVRPYLESHGGGVELLSVEGGAARLRLEGSCNGCPSSTATLKLAIEDAIHKAAPEVERVVAEGTVDPGPPLLQIELSESLRSEPTGSWVEAGGMADLPGDVPLLREIAGEEVLFVRLGRGAYAYRPSCPACRHSLEDGRLNGARLECAECGLRYDVRHAGRCLDDPETHLEPVPLLADGEGRITVALGAAV